MMESETICRLQRLQEQVRRIVDSRDQGNSNLRGTDDASLMGVSHWRGVPLQWDESKRIPYVIELENSLWAQVLGFDLGKYYTDPATYLEAQLRMIIYKYEWRDHTSFSKTIPLWLGSPFEPSMFGVEVISEPGQDPWIGKTPVVKEYGDIARLAHPDFRKSGLMPAAHRLYEGIAELLDDDFRVIFPKWNRSPFAVALHTRGIDNILVDMLSEPEFAQELIDFMVEARLHWERERAAFLGQDLTKCDIANDEVNCPLLSPRLYKECVLPGEKRISQCHGGIAYWHSCGNITELVSLIAQIPNLDMVSVSGWTDLRTAVMEFGRRGIAMEICLHPVRDLQVGTAEHLQQKLLEIKNICTQNNVCPSVVVRASGFQVFKSVADTLGSVKRFLTVAEEVLGNRAP